MFPPILLGIFSFWFTFYQEFTLIFKNLRNSPYFSFKNLDIFLLTKKQNKKLVEKPSPAAQGAYQRSMLARRDVINLWEKSIWSFLSNFLVFSLRKSHWNSVSQKFAPTLRRHCGLTRPPRGILKVPGEAPRCLARKNFRPQKWQKNENFSF